MEQIGRYIVGGEIGKGGFGAVYRAWDPEMRRNVAIKVLTSVNDPGMLTRFRSEAGTTGILKHKNIITVYDFGEYNSAPYLVMELIEGRSLREVIEAVSPLSLSEKVGILGEIARGLLHAHQNGVIHRDVKPANIMLLADGGVKILDFGIARMANPDLTRQTSTGMMVGTPQYMAPEQFAGEDATAFSDIFAYGVVCYELLSGEHPFRASNPMAVINLVANKVPAPLRTLVPNCPEVLESIVQMAMAKRSTDRYHSLQELLFDLAPIEAGFRKDRVDAMAAEARQSLEAGDLDSAQKLVWRALELEPNDFACQELRRRIQQRDRPALEERWKVAIEVVEHLLRRNSFDAAILALEAMQGSLSSDSVSDLRTDLEARLSAAREAREQAQRIAALLTEAQDAAGRRDLAGASRVVGQVLQFDSGNTVAIALAGWVSVEAGRARAEAQEAGQHREEPPKVTRDVGERQPPSRSGRWILVIAGCALAFVAGVSFIWWTPKPAAHPESTPPVSTPPVVQPTLLAGSTKVNPKDGLTYVWIPAGMFQMGCSPGDSGCFGDEKPAHQVTITKGFWIGQTEVTQEAYQQVTGTNLSNFKGVRLPVENITWFDAESYCQKVDMRLPTEAEWEYAARAGSTGSRYGNLDGIGWYDANSGSKTHEVAGKQANAWGLNDTLGNVWEWVADWYADQYPPGNATDPRGPATGTYRTFRGGSWDINARNARVSSRDENQPSYDNSVLGVRCVGN